MKSGKCEWCDTHKDNILGMCSNCHRFPVKGVLVPQTVSFCSHAVKLGEYCRECEYIDRLNMDPEWTYNNLPPY